MAGYCPDVQTKIVDQMNAWDNEDCGNKPGDTEPNGQKVLISCKLKEMSVCQRQISISPVVHGS